MKREKRNKIIVDKKREHTQRGFSILFVALLIASVTTTFSFVLSSGNFNFIRTVELSYDERAVENLLISCRDEALMEVRNDPGDDLSGSGVFESGECEYEVDGSVPEKTLDVSVVYEDWTRENTLTITQVSPIIQFE